MSPPPLQLKTRLAPVEWDADRVAEHLVERRDRLIGELPRHTRGAIGLTRDQQEWVVDDAITFVTTEYSRPILDLEDLERAFWSTAAHRVRRVHEGRGETVRAGWRRVDVADTVLPDHGDTPETAVLRRDEHDTVLEFVAMLTGEERRVFAQKYGVTSKPQGYKVIAQQLGLPVGAVRSAERSIEHKLERFTTIVAAGALCRYKGGAVVALADETATELQALAARVHLRGCASCRSAYKQRRRALRRGDFQREVVGLLPLPAAATVEEGRGGGGGPLHAFIDWVTRPFGGEGLNAVTATASSGAGRGIGTVAALKMAALCAGGAAVGGGAYCTVTGDWPTRDRAPLDRPVAKDPPTASSATTKDPAEFRYAERRGFPEPKSKRATRKARRSPQPTREEIRRDTAVAEAPMVSDAPASASGNDFDFEQTGSSSPTPATRAPEAGGSEFLP